MNEPLLHKFETTQAFGKSSLKTVIEYTYIDESLTIQSIDHVINGTFEVKAERESYLAYIQKYGRKLITKAEKDIEHMSEIARRHDEWLRDELRITGATA